MTDLTPILDELERLCGEAIERAWKVYVARWQCGDVDAIHHPFAAGYRAALTAQSERHAAELTERDANAASAIEFNLAIIETRDAELAAARQRIAELEARYERCHCGADLAPSGFNYCEGCPRECANCQAVGADCGLECRR